MAFRPDRVYTSPHDDGYYNGFRVVYVPEPATLCFLTLGGLAVMRHRR